MADRPHIEMTPERWRATSAFIGRLFGEDDPRLAEIAARAEAAGLPPIAVDAPVGRLLAILCGCAGPDGRGAGLAVELGTLAGYSGTWIARGLRPGGRLVTFEPEPAHAAVARGTFERLGLADRVEVREEPALAGLERLARAAGAGAVDFAFVDAVKTEYPAYVDALTPLVRVGGTLAIDNILGSSSWWVDRAPEGDAERAAARAGAIAAAERIARDPRWLGTIVPLREGVLLARRVG